MEFESKTINGKTLRCIKDGDNKKYISIADFSNITNISLTYSYRIIDSDETIKADREDQKFPKQLFKGKTLRLISTGGLKKCIESSIQPKSKKDNAYKIIEEIENVEKCNFMSPSTTHSEGVPTEIHKHIEYLNNQIEILRKQLNNNNTSFIEYRTRKERLYHKTKIDQANEMTKQLKNKVKKLTNINFETINENSVWRDIWDEILFQVTGLDSIQLKSQRNVLDSQTEIKYMLSIKELEELVNVLDYVIYRLNKYSSSDKNHIHKLIYDLCCQYEKDNGR